MAGEGGVQRGLSDLPADLLGVVYLSCFSAYNRARFAAVCASWRAVASWHPPLPALPLLLPFTGDGERDLEAQAYSPEDGRVLRLPRPQFPSGSRLIGSHDGGWIAASAEFGSEILIVNPFSGVQVALSAGQLDESTVGGSDLQKIIFSEDPTSSGCIAAAITGDRTVGLRRIGCPELGWTTRGLAHHLQRYYEVLEDILFYNGELYGLIWNWFYGRKQLLKFDTDLTKDGAPTVASVRTQVPFTFQQSHYYGTGHIFELHGKLAMAVEVSSSFADRETCCVRVFELVGEPPYDDSAWVEVTSLGDCALFVGDARCKAVRVSTRRGEVQKNCIYHAKGHYGEFTRQFSKRINLGSSDVYHWPKDDRVHRSSERRIMSRGYHYNIDVGNCMWLLPPDF